MRISVTGHMDLTEASLLPIRTQIEKELTAATSPSDVTGVSGLARGADTVFAEAVLDLGGSLEVVLPSRDDRQRKVKPDHAPQFDRLVERAGSVRVLPTTPPTRTPTKRPTRSSSASAITSSPSGTARRATAAEPPPSSTTPGHSGSP